MRELFYIPTNRDELKEKYDQVLNSVPNDSLLIVYYLFYLRDELLKHR